jgi:hypothetical protein
MATPAAISSTLVLLLVAFTPCRVGAATFYITNGCTSTVFPAAMPVAHGNVGGMELKPGETWPVKVDAGASGRIWPRTGCSFDPVTGLGSCDTGDCGGVLHCVLSGKPPATLAVFTIGQDGGAQDSYGVSVVDGFNIPMDFSCSPGGIADGVIRCRDPGCPDANHRPGDGKYRACQGNGEYDIVFCPST